MKLTDEEYSKVREVCLKEYLRRPYSRFWTENEWSNGWSLPTSWVDKKITPVDYFNEYFIPNALLNVTKLTGLIILMKDVDTVSVVSSIHTTKFLPLKALTVGRIMIIRENAEIKIRAQ